MKTTRYRYEVLLPTEETHDAWKTEAKNRGMAVSELIKTAVANYLQQTTKD